MKKIVVIGGGVSGLTAAITAKSENNQVIILERNASCGKKILVTGAGKCNYTNQDQDLKHYHSNHLEYIPYIINSKTHEEMLAFYRSIGIFPKIKNGYYYPYSNQAVTVCNALLKECSLKKIEIRTNCLVKKIIKQGNSFLVQTEEESFLADKVIVAAGSKAYPKLGTDGISYELLKDLNHSIIEVLPALVQLKCSENLKDCSGVRSDVEISLYENNSFVKKEVGEILFTDYGISGICSMQLSRFISRGISQNKHMHVEINFISDMNDISKKIFLENNSFIRERTVCEVLDSFLNYKLTNYLLKKNHIPENKKYIDLTEKEKEIVLSFLTKFSLNIIGTNSFDSAQVCCGGIPLSEINPHTMESTIVPNLYIVGEVLDVDGDCGGYNITFASITGIIAGGACRND